MSIIYLLLCSCIFVLRTSAQISLLSAVDFGVLGASAVTNTGATVIDGDLGVSPQTAITGFPPGVVVNGVQHVADGPANTANSDARAAFNAINAEGSTETLTGQDLGDMVLLAGTYFFLDSAQLTGQLVLDGQNDPDGQFLFQIGSTLTTASASSIILINGAQACNVFWAVGTSATLGTSTTFVGNIIADQSITANNGASVSGGLYALVAAVTLDNNAIASQECQVLSSSSSTVPPTTTTVPPTTTTVPVTTDTPTTTEDEPGRSTVPGTTIPGTTIPGTTLPDTTIPPSTVPATTIPATTIEDTTIPPTTIPETTIPETTIPGTTLPGTTLPDTTIPPTTILPTIIPETTIPGTTIPGTTLPDTTIPGTTILPTIIPETTIPGTTIPGTTLPDTTIPGTTISGTTISGTTISGTTIQGTTLSGNTTILSLPSTTISPTSFSDSPITPDFRSFSSFEELSVSTRNLTYSITTNTIPEEQTITTFVYDCTAAPTTITSYFQTFTITKTGQTTITCPVVPTASVTTFVYECIAAPTTITSYSQTFTITETGVTTITCPITPVQTQARETQAEAEECTCINTSKLFYTTRIIEYVTVTVDAMCTSSVTADTISSTVSTPSPDIVEFTGGSSSSWNLNFVMLGFALAAIFFTMC